MAMIGKVRQVNIRARTSGGVARRSHSKTTRRSIYCTSIQYERATRGTSMDKQEWITRCSERLQAQWPRVPAEQLVEVAAEIQCKVLRQLEDPQCAAVEWLRQGMPDPEALRDVG